MENKINKDLETQAVSDKEPLVDRIKRMSLKSKILGVIVLLVALGGVGFGVHVILSGQRTISTGNARVTTDLITITSTTSSLLERFDVFEGMNVTAGQVIGWVQYGETFRSPIDGIVVSSNVAIGQQILPMQTLATIADVNNLHIQANLYESDIQDVRLGQPVIVTLDGVRGQTFGGYVRNISRITELELIGGAIMVQTGTFRRITHTVPVEIAITDDIDLSFFLGTNARVSLPVLSSDEGLVAIAVNSSLSNQITATGRVESTTTRNIYPAHALRIEDVLVRLGDYVEAGQVLATLDITNLETSILTHQIAIEQMTTQGQLQRQETQRMLGNALGNMNNNTNLNMVDATAQMTASRLQAENDKRIYDQAQADYQNRTNPQVVAAEGFLRTTQLELERLRSTYNNMTILHSAGAIASQEMQQTRNAVVYAENQYNGAVINHQNAIEAELRNLEQLRVAVDSANLAYETAREVVRSVEIAARQEIENLQSNLEIAQIDETAVLQSYERLNKSNNAILFLSL